MSKETILIEVVRGPAGKCLSVNDFRVAGPKPWGGGKVESKWEVDPNRLTKALETRGYRLVRERQWISVSERLPEKFGYYLATIKVGEYASHITVVRFEEGVWTWSLSEFKLGNELVAWMYLPAPFTLAIEKESA